MLSYLCIIKSIRYNYTSWSAETLQSSMNLTPLALASNRVTKQIRSSTFVSRKIASWTEFCVPNVFERVIVDTMLPHSTRIWTLSIASTWTVIIPSLETTSWSWITGSIPSSKYLVSLWRLGTNSQLSWKKVHWRWRMELFSSWKCSNKPLMKKRSKGATKSW